MVANKKRPARPPEWQAILSLRLEATRQRDELIEQALRLQAAGKHDEAQILLKTAQYLDAHVMALENHGRHSSTKPPTRPCARDPKA